MLHPPVAPTTKVRVTDELRTGDLRALHGIELCASVELHNDELHSSKQHGDNALALKAYVASVCFKCFICLRGMLQMFRMNVAKVDWDVAMLQWLYTYVANVCSQCFIYFFRRMLQVCLSGCCIFYTHMLQVFYLDVTYVCNGFFKCFFNFSNACF